MHIGVRSAVLTFVLLLFAAFSAAQSPTERLSSELEKVAVEEMQAEGIPGAAMGIVRGSKILLAKGFGAASVEAGVPVTADTLFRLGSTTKMFTAAAFVQMALDGMTSFGARSSRRPAHERPLKFIALGIEVDSYFERPVSLPQGFCRQTR